MKYIFLKTICLYKKFTSPILHYFAPRCGCRFYPTCSEYFYQAIKKFGVIGGIYKGARRIIRCHPYNPGGHDPI